MNEEIRKALETLVELKRNADTTKALEDLETAPYKELIKEARAKCGAAAAKKVMSIHRKEVVEPWFQEHGDYGRDFDMPDGINYVEVREPKDRYVIKDIEKFLGIASHWIDPDSIVLNQDMVADVDASGFPLWEYGVVTVQDPSQIAISFAKEEK
jgi:hypothetical protein